MLFGRVLDTAAAQYGDGALHAERHMERAHVPGVPRRCYGEIRPWVRCADTEVETAGERRAAVRGPSGFGDLGKGVIVRHAIVPNDMDMVSGIDGHGGWIELVILHL